MFPLTPVLVPACPPLLPPPFAASPAGTPTKNAATASAVTNVLRFISDLSAALRPAPRRPLARVIACQAPFRDPPSDGARLNGCSCTRGVRQPVAALRTVRFRTIVYLHPRAWVPAGQDVGHRPLGGKRPDLGGVASTA